VPGEIADHVPVERTGSGILVTAWDKDGVEDAGLVKIDLLVTALLRWCAMPS